MNDIASRVPTMIHDLYREVRQTRDYIGASEVGTECLRAIWYSVREPVPEEIPGRIGRIFERGHREESWVLDDLRQAGFEIERQEFRTRGLLSGTCDGIATIDGKRYVIEVKCLAERSWKEIQKKGLQKGHAKYWAQCHAYMHIYELDQCLFIAVNKNNDEILCELVQFESGIVARLENAIHLVSMSPDPLTRIAESPGWWQCKICPHYERCWSEC